jgi:hypothetical protein
MTKKLHNYLLLKYRKFLKNTQNRQIVKSKTFHKNFSSLDFFPKFIISYEKLLSKIRSC